VFLHKVLQVVVKTCRDQSSPSCIPQQFCGFKVLSLTYVDKPQDVSSKCSSLFQTGDLHSQEVYCTFLLLGLTSSVTNCSRVFTMNGRLVRIVQHFFS